MLADLGKIWSIFTPTEKREAAWMLVLAVMMAGAETLGVLSVMPFLSVLGRPEVIQENSILHALYARLGFHDSRDFLFAVGLASIAVIIGAATFKTITLYLINRFVHFLRHSLSARLLSRYLNQPYEFFLTHNSSRLSQNVLSEVDQLLFSLIQPLSQLLAQGAVVIAMTALILWYDPMTALAIVISVGSLYSTIYTLVRKRLARIGNERHSVNGQRFQACNEALSGIKDVKITGSAEAYQEKFNRASMDLSRHMAASETISQTPLFLVEAVGYTGLILIALALMLQRQDIAHALPAMGLYGFAAFRMLPAIQIMYRGFAKLRFSSSALETIRHDLALPQAGVSRPTSIVAPRREIRLDHVSYAYPSTPGKPVLIDLSLVIPAGTCVGLVGRTGAGKSTLMDILLGLLAPQSGSLRVDGMLIDSANVAEWQRAIGYVPQHIYLADASVAENIAFGVPLGAIDMAAIERAAKAAQIHDFVVNELTNGYWTTIGDRGTRLSGGQRQRIGIARALYHDPPVLFMDEATSALDPETEKALGDAISRLPGGKTVVIIAHRRASLANCDDVIAIGCDTAVSA